MSANDIALVAGAILEPICLTLAAAGVLFFVYKMFEKGHVSP